MRLYIAGPYTSTTIFGTIYNILQARKVAQKLWRAGHTVICPHMNSALMTGVPLETWYEKDLELLELCEGIVMLPKWIYSTGARSEYLKAISENKHVFRWESVPDKDTLLRKEVW